MALTPCLACGHSISDQAPNCPQCGHPQLLEAEPVVDPSPEPAALAQAKNRPHNQHSAYQITDLANGDAEFCIRGSGLGIRQVFVHAVVGVLLCLMIALAGSNKLIAVGVQVGVVLGLSFSVLLLLVRTRKQRFRIGQHFVRAAGRKIANKDVAEVIMSNPFDGGSVHQGGRGYGIVAGGTGMAGAAAATGAAMATGASAAGGDLRRMAQASKAKRSYQVRLRYGAKQLVLAKNLSQHKAEALFDGVLYELDTPNPQSATPAAEPALSNGPSLLASVLTVCAIVAIGFSFGLSVFQQLGGGYSPLLAQLSKSMQFLYMASLLLLGPALWLAAGRPLKSCSVFLCLGVLCCIWHLVSGQGPNTMGFIALDLALLFLWLGIISGITPLGPLARLFASLYVLLLVFGVFIRLQASQSAGLALPGFIVDINKLLQVNRLGYRELSLLNHVKGVLGLLSYISLFKA
ncbi:MAG: zinc ribbon domain-containing protein [Cellvibrionaceae bacterium]|nr:zinc ribbon domain-containing protein [Cellvibrionaceae bacterium]